ncbi:MAG: pilus assembly protein [Alphaproteobacteria bacterium]|nr:pilus assembly protein [Alphaproteobacteria bacterium]
MLRARAIKYFKKDESGASAIEFAIIAPIFILLIVGTADMGFFVLEKMKLHNVVQTTAVYAAQAGSTDSVQTVAQETYQGDFADLNITSVMECECSDGVASGCPLSCGSEDYQRRFVLINGTGNFTTLFPYPGLPENISISTQARVRVD